MARLLVGAALALSLVALGAKPASAGEQKPGKCSFSKPERIKKHATDHLKLPANGKVIKASCKKEWPDEFTKAEWACFDKSIEDGREYKTPAELLAAVGVE